MYLLLLVIFTILLHAIYVQVRSPVWTRGGQENESIKVMFTIQIIGCFIFLLFGPLWGFYEMKHLTPDPVRLYVFSMGLFHAIGVNIATHVTHKYIIKERECSRPHLKSSKQPVHL
jgi:hypothetical protein